MTVLRTVSVIGAEGVSNCPGAPAARAAAPRPRPGPARARRPRATPTGLTTRGLGAAEMSGHVTKL